MKKRILVLLLIVSGFWLSVLPAFAADSSAGGFQLSDTSIGVRVGDYTRLFAYYGSTEALGVTWVSQDETVATVGSDGMVTGQKTGQTIVTAYCGSDSASCVVNVAFQGIDVSSWQNSIDWAAVKNSGVDFAMIRTGLGSSGSQDAYFETNYTNAKANGIKVGVYHVAYATNPTIAEQEADYCLQILGGKSLDYPIAYDLERTEIAGLTTDMAGQVVQAFCNRIEAAGYKAVVYSYVSFYRAHLTSPLVSQYDTWIANTGVDSTSFSPYTMWQYGQRTVPGVTGSCDVDYSFCDYAGGATGQSVSTPTTPTLPETSEQIFTSDTTGTYTFGSNQDYYYKITTNDTITPSASSSDPSVVSVSYAKRLTDGFLFKITNHGPGQALITTTAGNGTQVSFTAVGTASGSAAPSSTAAQTQTDPTGSSVSGGTLQCDTTQPYTFGSNSAYIYKITTSGSTAPTAVSSNPSAVTVSFYQKTSGGYLYKIANAGTGTAEITTTAADGASASFLAYGTSKSPVSGGTLQCDTTQPYTFGSNSAYIYKITTSGSTAPTAVSSNPSAVTVSFYQKTSGGYLYKIANAGTGAAVITTTAADGASASFTANGTASVQKMTGIASDTPYLFSMKKGGTYVYKFTPSGSAALSFTTGNGSVLQIVSVSHSGGNYYCKVRAAAAGQTGIYAAASGQKPQRLSIVTVG